MQFYIEINDQNTKGEKVQNIFDLLIAIGK